jgi:outer membrane protein W
MKKHIIRLLAVSTCIVFALSQNAKAQDKIWSLGPEIGANFSKYGQDGSNSDVKAGFIGGLALTYSIENIHAITGKLLYSRKGAEVNGIKQSLNYVEVPVIGRFFFNRSGSFRPNIFVGPSFGLLTSASNKIGENNPTQVNNFNDTYKRFDFGITGGLGLNFLIARETRLLFDARYTHGLSDVTKASGFINNRAIALTTGISFGISR